MSLFSLDHVTRVYGRRTVLEIPKLDIEGNRIHALLGPNGAGKTTLLNILGFLEPPNSGTIHFRSQPVRFVEAELQHLRRSAVLVDQHPILFSTTVYKNLEFGLKIRGITPDKRRRIIEENLDLVGMGSFTHYPAHRLSGGETQRVALARALALSPEVLLCDEPTSSVDVENQNLIITILKRINEMKKISVLFTTHDRSQAARLAHHTIVLNQGRLAPTMYENIFRGVLKSDPSGRPRCVIQDKIELAVPEAQIIENRETVSVFIDPEKIVPQHPLKNPGTANQLQGRVVQIVEENGKVRIVIDAGVWIALLISKKSYQVSKFMVGETNGLIIPPEAIHIM
ncbi:MAG: ABC transporter ATP-binding protein [Deltaproteobacteria bacterium]|jgi:tungstate transport system ATP-binding protein|nr:ABC transporter ATP-binding protein [Deltaproteobacteria bacterium]MBW2479201.1 ABC transporter ATP-binding protein [Deltaproteobacteria bacterium]